MEQARLDFVQEVDLEQVQAEAAPIATDKAPEQFEDFIDFGVSDEPPTAADPSGRSRAPTRSCRWTPARARRARKPPPRGRKPPQTTLWVAPRCCSGCAAHPSPARATPAAANVTAGASAEEEEEMVQVEYSVHSEAHT